MTAFPWKSIAAPSAVTIDLNSVANGARARSTARWDNKTTRFTSLSAVLKLGAAAWASTPALVYIWLIPHLGSDEATSGTEADPVVTDSTLGSVFHIWPGNSARIAICQFPPPRVMPLEYRVMVRNDTGVAFAGSGNSLTIGGTVLETAT